MIEHSRTLELGRRVIADGVAARAALERPFGEEDALEPLAVIATRAAHASSSTLQLHPTETRIVKAVETLAGSAQALRAALETHLRTQARHEHDRFRAARAQFERHLDALEGLLGG